jgi:hypothetical protein
MLTATPPRVRTIEVVPPLLVALLNDAGKLPAIPNEPRAGALGFRRPTLEDMKTVKWLACWDGSRTDKDGFRKVGGLATFRDVFDWHTSSEVRELLAIRGTPRSTVALVNWLVADGLEHDRRLVGAVQKNDVSLIHLLERLGGTITRRFMEYGVAS